MCNWKKWIWPGILATLLLTALAVLMKSGPIEQDLQAKTMDRLSNGYEWASVKLDGRDLTLLGEAPSEDAVTEALQLADDAHDVRVATAETTLIPLAEPFALSAVKSANGIRLEGSVPYGEARQAIVSAAQSANTGLQVTDNLVVARGAPDGFGDLAGFALAQLGHLETGEASLSNLDMSLSGLARDSEAYEAITAALSGTIPAAGQLASADITPPVVSPYRFSATVENGTLTLEGHAGSPDEKAALLGSAKEAVPDAEIVDRLSVASGAPNGVNWLEASVWVVSEAALLHQGRAGLTDTAYSIDGMARSNDNFDRLAAAADLPSGIRETSRNISRPVISPYVWRFENPEEGAPTLAGFVPDENLVSALRDQVVSSLGTGADVNNALEVGDGAPDGFADIASFAVQTASRLNNGKAELNGTQLSVSGEAFSDAAAEEIRATLDDALPAGFTIEQAVKTRSLTGLPTFDNDECQQALNGLLGNNVVRFESGSSAIRAASFGLLDRLSFTAKRCPTATIEISGHTDADGDDALNQRLSDARANAVRSYLVNTGIYVGRLKAVGYGETRPVADNTSDEGKARNRRIEFNVVRQGE